MATLLRRSRTPKRRRDQPLPRTTVLRGLVIFAVFLFLVVMALRLYNGVPTTNYVDNYISVPNVGNLLPHDAVRIGGKRIGQVYSIDLGDDGRPRVKLQLNPDTKLPADTTVTIRANGLLGARFVQLTPGTSEEMLAENATIRGGTESFTNGLPEAIDTFDRGSRENIQILLGELSKGLLSNGQPLNELNKDLAVGPRKFGEVAEGILAQDGAAARFIPSLESAMGALEPNKQYNRPFLVNGRRAATPFAVERQAVRDILSKAPATLSAATDGLTRGRPLLGAVRDLSEAAAVTLPPAPAAFDDLAALMAAAPGPLRDLLPITRDKLPTAAEGATRVLVEGDSKLVPLANQAVNLSRTQLDYIGDHACDVINFGAVMRSMTGFGQAGIGPNGRAMAFRLEAVVPEDLRTVAGLKADDPALFERSAYEEPCAYMSEPYPQLSDGPQGVGR